MKKIHHIHKAIKIILYRLGLLNLISKIRNKTFSLLKNGYSPKVFWNAWSDIYFNQPCRQEFDLSHAWLLDKVSSLKPASILEIGCGFGKNLAFLRQRLSTSPVFYGMDISESMVNKARDFLGGASTLSCGDILNLPFKDHCFDLVFTHGTLMHISSDNIQKALSELKRVSGKDILIIEEILWTGERQKEKEIKLNEYTFMHDYEHLFHQSGFDIVSVQKYEDYVDLICLHIKSR